MIMIIIIKRSNNDNNNIECDGGACAFRLGREDYKRKGNGKGYGIEEKGKTLPNMNDQ